MSSAFSAKRIVALGPLVVLLVLSAVELHSIDSSDDCVVAPDILAAGDTLTLSIDQPTWLSTSTSFEHVYRVEASGNDGARLEIWISSYDSGTYCQNIRRQDAAAELSHGATLEWTQTSELEVIRLVPSAAGVTEELSLTMKEVAAPPPGKVTVIPAVAHAPGVAGAFFQTDVRIFNPYNQAAEVLLVLAASEGQSSRTAEVTVAPYSIVALDDVVHSQLGLDNATGALSIHSLFDLVVISRTYTETERGTVGQFIAAEPWSNAAGRFSWFAEDSTRYLLPVGTSERYRYNLGLVEVLGLEAELTIAAHDRTGTVIASRVMSLSPFSHKQINNVLGFLGIEDLESGGISVKLDSHARVFAYVSVIDELSSDPVYNPGLARRDAAAKLYLPVAAAGSGGFGSQWRTDLRVLAVAPTEGVFITFIPTDGSRLRRGLFAMDGGVLAIDDVVSRLGGRGSGALSILSYGTGAQRILATSRTYNLTAAGTYGQLIPALDFHGAINRGVVIGVDRSEEYRTNFGMFNPNLEAVDVIIRLVSAAGNLLGSATQSLAPESHIQLNDIFAVLNVPWQRNCRVDIEVDHSWQGVHAYASVIDNQSGDAIYIPGTKIPGLEPAAIEISNRSNAILIDKLEEAVGIDRLPAGELTAMAITDGNLGRPELPIQVLCLYKSPAGELRSAILANGDSISGISGDERFWCVIPDWISKHDNVGGAEISISGGGEPITLSLDAHDSSVLLDRQPASVVSVMPSAETYQVEITGNLGRPELTPQVVVMYRDAESRLLRVHTPGNGEIIDRVDTGFQLLVTVVDWIRSDDNTGTTTLTPVSTPGTRCSSVVAVGLGGAHALTDS
jgi:hypothetical protein